MEEIKQEDFLSPVAIWLDKRIKAVDIVFKKYVDVCYLRVCHTADQYNRHIRSMDNSGVCELTKEEFDLLKEMQREVWVKSVRVNNSQN